MYTEIRVSEINEIEKSLDALVFLSTLKTEGLSVVRFGDYEITYWPELGKFYVGIDKNYQHLPYEEVVSFLKKGETPEKIHAELSGDFGWSFH